MAIYRHEFAFCPWCEKETGSRVDHLYDDTLPRSAGPWYCNACGQPFNVLVKAPSDVEITKAEGHVRSFSRAMSLLKFDGKEGAVFFVMDHNHYHSGEPETDDEFQSHTRFFFEEHSCPTNWLDECVAVIADGDSDPHGFLSFVRAVDVPQDFNEDDDNQWPILFPEAFSGETIDGELTPPMISQK
jgi:hypothetical protein